MSSADLPEIVPGGVGSALGGVAAIILAIGKAMSWRRVQERRRTNDDQHQELIERLDSQDRAQANLQSALSGSLGVGGLVSLVTQLQAEQEEHAEDMRLLRHAMRDLITLTSALVGTLQDHGGVSKPQLDRAAGELFRITSALKDA